jgi:hypothetical protein
MSSHPIFTSEPSADPQPHLGRAAAVVLKARGVAVEPGYRHAEIDPFEVVLTHRQSARFDPTEMERAAFRGAGSDDWPRAQTHRLEVFHRAKGGKRRRVLMVLWAPHRHLIERFARGPWERDLIALANSVM